MSKNLDWSNLKEFELDKINFTQLLKFVMGWAVNSVGKAYQHFSISHIVFESFL